MATMQLVSTLTQDPEIEGASPIQQAQTSTADVTVASSFTREVDTTPTALDVLVGVSFSVDLKFLSITNLEAVGGENIIIRTGGVTFTLLPGGQFNCGGAVIDINVNLDVRASASAGIVRIDFAY